MHDNAINEAVGLKGGRFGYMLFCNEDKQHFTLNTWSK